MLLASVVCLEKNCYFLVGSNFVIHLLILIYLVFKMVRVRLLATHYMYIYLSVSKTRQSSMASWSTSMPSLEAAFLNECFFVFLYYIWSHSDLDL